MLWHLYINLFQFNSALIFDLSNIDLYHQTIAGPHTWEHIHNSGFLMLWKQVTLRVFVNWFILDRYLNRQNRRVNRIITQCFAVFRVKVDFERALLVLEYGKQCSYIKLYLVVILYKFLPHRVMLNGFKRHVYNATVANWMNRIAHCIKLSMLCRKCPNQHIS